MRIFTEKDAENFLEKNGFEVVKRTHIKKEPVLSKIKIKFPIVIKASGSKIIHKNKLGGIKMNIKSKEELLNAYNQLSKIKGFEGAMIQEQIKGKEILLGIKRTPEFGHVIVFGAGGIYTEKLKDVSFRVYPLSKKDIFSMIHEVKISKELNKSMIKKIKTNLIKICKLIKKFPKIKELDINPLITNNKNATIVDARIGWD